MKQDPNPVEIKVTSTADLGAVEKTTEEINKTTEATKKQGLTEEEIAAKKAQRDKEYADWQEANREKNEKEYALWKKDHEARVSGIKEETVATKELSAAEEDRARRKAEFDARTSASRANGTNVSTPADAAGNPMAMGALLREEEQLVEVKRRSAEMTWAEAAAADDLADKEREVVQATEEQTKALEKQREADVQRAQQLKRTREEVSEAQKGYDKLFDQQRMQANAQLFRELAQAVGEFGRKFAETEQGKKAMEGLSDETQVFGSTFATVGAGVAQGAAVGGPIGAAIGGLTALVKKFGDEWINTANRVEQSNQEMEAGLEATRLRMKEREDQATSDRIRKAYEAERKELERQRDVLEDLSKLRDAKGDLAVAKDKLADTRAANAGVPQAAIDIGNVGEQLTRQRADLAADLEKNRAELQILVEQMWAAQQAFKEKLKQGATAAENSEEARNLKTLADQVDVAERNFAALKQRLAVQEETFATEAQAELESQKGKLLGSLEQSAEKLQADLQRAVQEQGGKQSDAARIALQNLAKILSDGQVSEGEVQQLIQVVQTLKNSREAADKAVIDGMNQLIKNTNLITDTLAKQTRDIDQQRRDLDRIALSNGVNRNPR